VSIYRYVREMCTLRVGVWVCGCVGVFPKVLLNALPAIRRTPHPACRSRDSLHAAEPRTHVTNHRYNRSLTMPVECLSSEQTVTLCAQLTLPTVPSRPDPVPDTQHTHTHPPTHNTTHMHTQSYTQHTNSHTNTKHTPTRIYIGCRRNSTHLALMIPVHMRVYARWCADSDVRRVRACGVCATHITAYTPTLHTTPHHTPPDTCGCCV